MYVDIGPAPANEECAQLGSDDYWRRAGSECAVYKRMLQRLFPTPEGVAASFVIRSHPHDFGTYQVAVRLGWGLWPRESDDVVQGAWEFACHVEDNAPETWDQQARFELDFDWNERNAGVLMEFSHGGRTGSEFPQQSAALAAPELDSATWAVGQTGAPADSGVADFGE